VIGDHGLRTLYGRARGALIESGDGQGARLLVRETSAGVRASLYLPDAMIRRLEAFPPTRGVGEQNVDAFATLVEEIDHLVVLADRVCANRPVSRFELELHANVSKWLVLSRFVIGRRTRLRERDRLWLRWHLFRKHEWVEHDPRVRRRYRDASRHAVRFLDGWSRSSPASRRIDLLRRFHDAPIDEKLELIRALAA
jgi:hypothetical protein